MNFQGWGNIHSFQQILQSVYDPTKVMNHSSKAFTTPFLQYLITKGTNDPLLMIEKRNAKRTHLALSVNDSPVPPERFWQGQAQSMLHTDKFSISSNSSGKRYECHCRWPSSIQLAETGQSAKGQLWGPGTPLIRLCLFQMAPLLCRLRQPLGWLKPWLCSSWRNTERGSRGTQSRQVRKRESVSSLTCRSALENECQNALELR